MGQERSWTPGLDIHHDRNRTLVGNSLEPLCYSHLACSTGEVAWCEHHTIRSTRGLGVIELDQRFLDVLGGSAGDDDAAAVPGLVECLALAADEVVAFGIGQMDGLARRTEDYEAFDAAFD